MAEQAASQGRRVEQREGHHGLPRAAFVFSSGPQLAALRTNAPVPHGTELPRQPLSGPQAAPARCRLRDELPGPRPCPAAPRWLPGGAPAAPGAGPEGSAGGCERPRAPPAATSVRGRGGLEAKRSPGGERGPGGARRSPPGRPRASPRLASPHLTAAPARPGGAGGSPRPPPALTARRAPRAATARNMAPPPPPRAALARAAPQPPPPHWAPRRANGRAPLPALLPAPRLSPPTAGRGQRGSGGWGGREAREGPLAEGGKRAAGGGLLPLSGAGRGRTCPFLRGAARSPVESGNHPIIEARGARRSARRCQTHR